jgi:hypothetical protein
MNAIRLRSAARRDKDFVGQFANPCITQPSEPATRFDKCRLANHSYIFATRGRVGLQARFARGERDMGGGVSVNACCERNNQHSIGAFVTIPSVQ